MKEIHKLENATGGLGVGAGGSGPSHLWEIFNVKQRHRFWVSLLVMCIFPSELWWFTPENMTVSIW